MSKIKLFLTIALVSLSAAACAHTTGSVVESQRAMASIHGMANQLNNIQMEIDKAVTALNDLSSGTNLTQAYNSYNRSINNILSARDRAMAQRSNMQLNGQQYISKWQSELETIQDNDVKSALADRKEKVVASFDDIRASLDGLRDAYQPLLTTAQEIRQALALDLTPAGVESLKPAIDKAKGQAETVKQKIAEVRGELEGIAGSMSPK